jgi:hypothetical protein
VSPAAQLDVAEASEGPGAEEAEVVVAGEGERQASGSERCDGRANWECRRLFYFAKR